MSKNQAMNGKRNVSNKKGAVRMISKNSKTCTIVSLGLLGSCIALGVVPFVIMREDMWVFLYYYFCCMLSGVSLIFSRGSRSKFLRGFVVIVLFLCSWTCHSYRFRTFYF